MWDHVRSVLVWLVHHRPSAAGLAAVAAFFSAFSSFLIWRVQRSNLLESVRPELVLLGWSRKPPGGPGAHEAVGFQTIKNVGRGTAFRVWLHAHVHEESGHRIADMSTMHHSLLAVNEQIDMRDHDGRILIWFDETKHGPVRVSVHASCWDSRGNEYDSYYDLSIFDSSHTVASDAIAPGVFGWHYRTIRPAWRIKLRGYVLRPWYAAVNAVARLRGKRHRD